MNDFIKNAITDRLREINEEKESLDASIVELEKKLKDYKQKQAQINKIIDETLAFLNESKKTAKKPAKSGQVGNRAS